jgi:hypothetical protein
MAITQLTSDVSQDSSNRLAPKEKNVRGITQSARTVLKLVPDFSSDNPAAVSSRSFAGIVGAMFAIGLLVLLGINIALTSGAFEMENLKLHLESVNDQKEALLNQVSRYSSPLQLASHARAIGMQPQSTINFLSISPAIKP